MNENLRAALREAMTLEYDWVPEPENLNYEADFSPKFEKKMKKLLRRMKEGDASVYVHIGGRTIRRAFLVALIAALIMAMTAGAIAIQRALVHWHETQNEEAGTLDVTFEVEDPNGLMEEFRYKKPETPTGYEIVDEQKQGSSYYEIQYENPEGKIIFYSQNGSVSTTGLGLDNEDANFQKVEINGYKGYSYSKSGTNALTWTDGMALYDIGGTCEMEVLWEMVRSLS